MVGNRRRRRLKLQRISAALFPFCQKLASPWPRGSDQRRGTCGVAASNGSPLAAPRRNGELQRRATPSSLNIIWPSLNYHFSDLLVWICEQAISKYFKQKALQVYNKFRTIIWNQRFKCNFFPYYLKKFRYFYVKSAIHFRANWLEDLVIAFTSDNTITMKFFTY